MIPSERNSGELNRRFLTPTFDPEVLKKPISRREANIRAHPAQPGKKNKPHPPNPAKARFTPQQAADTLGDPNVNAFRSSVHPKVLLTYHFGTDLQSRRSPIAHSCKCGKSVKPQPQNPK
jgi:hypothetical protein